MLAIKSQYSPEMIIKLLDAGATIQTKNKQGQTALHIASIYNTNVIELLLSRGASVNAIDYLGQTPLLMSIITNLDLEVVDTFIKAKANLNLTTNNNESIY